MLGSCVLEATDHDLFGPCTRQSQTITAWRYVNLKIGFLLANPNLSLFFFFFPSSLLKLITARSSLQVQLVPESMNCGQCRNIPTPRPLGTKDCFFEVILFEAVFFQEEARSFCLLSHLCM
jgi:hypothetical protein